MCGPDWVRMCAVYGPRAASCPSRYTQYWMQSLACRFYRSMCYDSSSMFSYRQRLAVSLAEGLRSCRFLRLQHLSICRIWTPRQVQISKLLDISWVNAMYCCAYRIASLQFLPSFAHAMIFLYAALLSGISKSCLSLESVRFWVFTPKS